MNTQQVSNKLSEKALLGNKSKPAKLWERWFMKLPQRRRKNPKQKKIKDTRLNDI